MPVFLLPLVLVCLGLIAVIALWCASPVRYNWPWQRVVDAIGAQYRAEQVARRLLQASLSPAEFEMLQQRGYLEIPSPTRAGRVYRIPYGPGRVAVYDNNHFTMSLCVQPTKWLPNADVVLLHKLHIEANESVYLSTANQLRYG